MTTLITGNTYPVKDQLKALGGKWDPNSKGWLVPDDKADAAKALMTPAKTTTPARRGYRPNGPNGICTRCGDDCGGTNWRCGYE